jgi:uncharacterized membrane protein
VPPLAILLVAVAAVLHAGWNVLLKTSDDPLRTAVRLQVSGTLLLVPIAVVAWLANGQPGLAPEAVGLALVSGVLEAVYFLCLSAAYVRGDLSLVYPLARGSAPLLAVLIGIGILGERLSPVAGLGVVALLAGILLVAQPWVVLRRAGLADRAAVGFALLTGVSIAAYSAVDRVGVRLVQPWLYGAVLAVAASVFLATAVAAGRRLGRLARPAPASRRTLVRDAATGVLSLGAYLLVLVAYSIAPLATVAPLRESGIVLAAAWGAIRLGEALSRRQAGVRVGAASLVVVGAVLLAAAP